MIKFLSKATGQVIHTPTLQTSKQSRLKNYWCVLIKLFAFLIKIIDTAYNRLDQLIYKT